MRPFKWAPVQITGVLIRRQTHTRDHHMKTHSEDGRDDENRRLDSGYLKPSPPGATTCRRQGGVFAQSL